MHSRIFIKSLSISLRTGVLGLSLTGFSIGSEQLLNYPMTGACFLHDSGLEYIPSRLLGVEDIVTESDRGQSFPSESFNSESSTWTCTDPAMDCAVEAERFEQRRNACEQWNRWYSSAESLRAWSSQSLSRGITRAMREWNSSLVAVGCGLAHRVSIDSPIDSPIDKASPWDDVQTSADATQEHCLGYIPNPRLRNANVFVFTVDITADATVDATADEEALKEQQAIDAGQVSSPSDRIVDSLGGTTFARDYCVFAPYPLSDAITPFTESSVLAGEAQTESTEDSINTRQTSSPCEWMGECEPADSTYVQGGEPRVPSEPTDSIEPTTSIEPIDFDEVVPSSEVSQPAEFSQPTELDQASDRASGAGPEDSAVAGVSDCEATPTIDSREILRAKQQVAVDLHRSISRALARNLSRLGQSLICWSKELDYCVRLSEAQDGSSMPELK